MAMEFDAPDFEPESLLQGGGAPKPGTYHVQVIDAKELTDKDQIELKFQIMSPGPECGKHHTEWLSCTGGDAEKTKKCQQRILGVALKLRLLKPDYYTQCRASKTPIALDFADALGCQAIIELAENKYTGKDGHEKVNVRMPFAGIYDLCDPKVADVPVDWDTAACWGRVPADPFVNPPATGATKAAPPATPPKAAQPKAPPAKPNGGAAPSIYDSI